MNYIRNYFLLAATVLTVSVYPKIVEVSNEADFQKEVLDKDRVVVKYYANWCPGCRKFAPIFKKVAEDISFENKVNFVAINFDDIDNGLLPTFKKFTEEKGILTIPTLIYFRKNMSEVIDHEANVRKEQELKANIKYIFELK